MQTKQRIVDLSTGIDQSMQELEFKVADFPGFAPPSCGTPANITKITNCQHVQVALTARLVSHPDHQ